MASTTGIDEQEARDRIRQMADKAGGVRALAREMECTPSYVSDVLNGRRAPGPAFLKAAKLRRVVVYVPV